MQVKETSLLRSTLFVPGNRPERFIKAVQAHAGAVIIDLEDAVAPGDKLTARSTVAKQIDALHMAAQAAKCGLFVRINAYGSPWYEDDARLCAQLPLQGVLVPKPQSAEQIAQVWKWTGHKPLHLLMETLQSFASIAELSRADGVARLMLGCADLMSELNIRDDDQPLNYFRTQLVMHSVLAGLPAPIDGPCLDLYNQELLAQEIDRAMRFGFGAKACIHPQQVSSVDSGFKPTPAQIAWAQKVLSTSTDGRAVSMDGKLIDGPICTQAARILAAAA